MHAGYGAVESAARHAARTISIARDPTAAVGVAETDAATTVRVGSPRCLDMGMSHTVTDDQVTVTDHLHRRCRRSRRTRAGGPRSSRSALRAA